ncbi:iron chaperone [Sinomicrobium weinanense]|uniref:DUF1801 domain-containing protein n=1 Tax=Sinomicrobium weinanense TaxID=2842200 RepID=A0A926JUZ9_9FLAO|nr:DUF1801 domain-containing protein [Sinomicrobium weinanense]MBC9798058.1 DUF1801 domain-containing protein [Sinomicrobium weinanense]MBU3122529.1 DUF1801 domain-containing protein [Sinomicrobium weinanense]
MKKPENVDLYIAGSAMEARPIMEELREIIRSTVPEAEEGISWGVPYYKYYGELGGFDAAKNHVSFGFDAGTLEDKDREMLEKKGYKLGKMTLQIRFDQKVPAAAIKKILKTKAGINEAKKAMK